MSESQLGHPPNSGSFKKGIIPWSKGKVRVDIQGYKHPMWKPKIEKPCGFCGKILYLAPNQVRNRNFCNVEHQRFGSRGPNANYYLGSNATTPLRKRIRQLGEYDEWHRAILKRDDYTCQQCYQRGGNLTVDHIKRFHFIILENNIKTTEEARNCKELWDTSNGRTICRKCFYTLNTHGTTGLKKHRQEHQT